jgi:hypothetical protein
VRGVACLWFSGLGRLFRKHFLFNKDFLPKIVIKRTSRMALSRKLPI